MDPQQEIDRLRAEVETYRQRELDELRQKLSEAEHAVEHYRIEAQRNADVGRQIAAEYQAQVADLRARLDAFERRQAASVRRTARPD